MNPKRGKGRGGTVGGFNRGRNRGTTNVANTTTFNQNDIGDIYKNPLMIHSIIKLLGCPVTVQTCNGMVFDGILKTFSSKGDVTLEVAHRVSKQNKGENKIEEVVEVPTRNQLHDLLVLGLKHIVYVSAINVDLEEVRKDTFTDSAISSRVNGQLGSERQLQKWEDPSAIPDESLMLDDSNMKNGLDPDEMFAANEKRGGKSDFDHKMLSYTTPVEGSRELEIKADRLAKEIQQENSFRERAEYDSGRTEEEIYSAVIRNTTSTERSQPPKPKQNHTPTRDESKREVFSDSPRSCSPKPQRVPLRELDVKLPDGASNPVTVIPVEQAKVSKEPSVPTPEEPPQAQSPVKPIKVQPKVVDEEQSGISILAVKKQPKEKSEEMKDLKQFSKNFQLKPQEQEENKTKKENKETEVSKDQPPANPANETEQQKDHTKTTEQKTTEAPPKTEEKSTFKWNINAKEFKPSSYSPINTKTPPLQQSPQPPIFASSPTSMRMTGFPPPLVRHTHGPKPRPIITGPRPPPFYRTDGMETGGQPISAAAAAGNPIIAPGHFPQFIAVQPTQQFGPNMVQQIQTQGYNMLHGPQGGQQHYMAQQTVGIPTSQAYQENPVPVYASNIQMANPSYPGSPQPSPTTTGQYLQYIPHVIAQPPGNQPHIPQAVMGAPPGQPQHVFVVPQPPQSGQQHVAMHGIPVSGPGNPLINHQFVAGPQQQHYPPGN